MSHELTAPFAETGFLVGKSCHIRGLPWCACPEFRIVTSCQLLSCCAEAMVLERLERELRKARFDWRSDGLANQPWLTSFPATCFCWPFALPERVAQDHLCCNQRGVAEGRGRTNRRKSKCPLVCVVCLLTGILLPHLQKSPHLWCDGRLGRHPLHIQQWNTILTLQTL